HRRPAAANARHGDRGRGLGATARETESLGSRSGRDVRVHVRVRQLHGRLRAAVGVLEVHAVSARSRDTVRALVEGGTWQLERLDKQLEVEEQRYQRARAALEKKIIESQAVGGNWDPPPRRLVRTAFMIGAGTGVLWALLTLAI